MCFGSAFCTDKPLQTDTAQASMERPTAMTNNSKRPIVITAFYCNILFWLQADKKTYPKSTQNALRISLVISCKAVGHAPSMSTEQRIAPTTPLTA